VDSRGTGGGCGVTDENLDLWNQEAPPQAAGRAYCWEKRKPMLKRLGGQEAEGGEYAGEASREIVQKRGYSEERLTRVVTARFNTEVCRTEGD